MPQCKNCKVDFTITDADRAFYAKMDVPEPSLCPDCRRQRRLAWRNERVLHRRQCSLCQKDIVSLYPAEYVAPVYCHDCWWSDQWETTEYGQPYDPTRSFFDQYAELVRRVPRLSIINSKSVNSDFCNYAYANKNCYLTIGCHYEEDCFYNDHSSHNHSCLELCRCGRCELSSTCLDSGTCYQCTFVDFSKDCTDCHFCYNCSGCTNCFLSSNIVNQKYYFKNQQLSQADYERAIAEYIPGSYQAQQRAWQEYQTILAQTIRKPSQQARCVDCLGDNLVNCKNLYRCFDAVSCADCAYSRQIDETYDSLDTDYMGYDRSELCLETIGCAGLSHCLACDSCWHNHHLAYCHLVFGSSECFGCVGLKNKKHCILNTQCTETEYATLRQQIVDDMKRRGEWGLFFPPVASPHGYNVTVAMEPHNFPLTAEGAAAFGGWWESHTPGTFGRETIHDLPDAIADVPDSITSDILACQTCQKNFKIIPEELDLCRQIGVPLPRLCPDCRSTENVMRRHPQVLTRRQCSRSGCANTFSTIYAPEEPVIIYCEECYRKEVY